MASEFEKIKSLEKYTAEDVVESSLVKDVENLDERMNIANEVCEKKQQELKKILEEGGDYFHHTILLYPGDDFVKKSIAISKISEDGIMTNKAMREKNLISSDHQGGLQEKDRVSLFGKKDGSYYDSGGSFSVASFIIKPNEDIVHGQGRYEDEFESIGNIDPENILGVVINGFYRGKVDYLNRVAIKEKEIFDSNDFIEGKRESIGYVVNNINKIVEYEGQNAKVKAVYHMIATLVSSMMNNPENSFPVFCDEDDDGRYFHKPASVSPDDLIEHVEKRKLFPLVSND